MYGNVIDNYNHSVTALDEYTLYCILYFAHDGTDDGFQINVIINEELQTGKFNRLTKQEVEWLNSVVDISSLIGICFEDTDFLDNGLVLKLLQQMVKIMI